ncbi:MAG: hypothetical protein CUN49_07130 [Candidatus Thermofonsia Clade 1 bacterium]|jgi:hypothetical protein|uniref:Uncharacterized protein n=1 Tax=Candidatus Thermofonsia Clade 1 bacterium TaxID=2364210 RepID=A0A2M8PEY8_9CHLR|nr:MAG: hypothetical protein CUN49_07130 [Candidatus Thermofonsia Clade 1 bacterium]RMF50219.1 MAG: hypothetical protein D6749_11125 [Chloroflexota bacterium]
MLPLLTLGLAVVGTLIFWSAVQNWLADLLQRAKARFGALAETLLSALVFIDRLVVNGRRIIALTARAIFSGPEAEAPLSVEEMREIAPESLPAEIRARLERGETLEYELALSNMRLVEKPKPNVTYRVVVRRADET